MRAYTPTEAATVLKHMRIGRNAGTVAGGVGGAAGLGIFQKHYKKDGKLHKKTTGQRIAGGVLGGILGAQAGSSIGALGGFATGSHAIKPKMPSWLKGVKTNTEAKAKFRSTARSRHPDLGGSHEKMKRVNEDWSKWEGKFKEAMLSAFADEIAKIASRR